MLSDAPPKPAAWQALKEHRAQLDGVHMRDLFTDDPARFEKFHIELDGFLFDYSKNLVTEKTIALLIDLAETMEIEQWRARLFSGDPVNQSEHRPALHMALRGSVSDDISVGAENVNAFVRGTLAQIKTVSDTVRAQKKFTDVVNIGIGGSDLGPHLVCEALRPFADGPKVHFVSNIDGAHIAQTLHNLNPETTLFVIASKTFSTLETLSNAQAAKDWLINAKGTAGVNDHFIAVTVNKDAAAAFGVKPENILPLREWIGGRYSLWGAIGLPIALAVGYDNFEALLNGARAMDEHFEHAPLKKNIPFMLAMLGVWHRNFCGHAALAVLPYAQNLERLPGYIQQLDMESNGKSVNRDGQRLHDSTSPVVFGGPGTNSQHAFFQMLHQGTDIVPCDFILSALAEHELDDHQRKLLANGLAQSEALMTGSIFAEHPYQTFDGNRPSNTIVLERLDAYHLGMLLALYEHKTFVQSVIWNINCFDQWGVELGKKLAQNILQDFDNADKNQKLDSSTRGLLKYIRKYTFKNS